MVIETKFRYESGTRVSRHADIDAYIEQRFGIDYREYRKTWGTTIAAHTLPIAGYPAPLHLVIEPNDSCNLKCSFCFRHAGLKGKSRSSNVVMSPKIFKRLIDEAANIGIKSIALSFGEPLLHPHVSDFLRYISKKDFFDVFLYTNGTRMQGDIIPVIVDTVTRLHISIDAATNQTYRKMRGKNLEDLRCNIDSFLELRDKVGGKTMLWVSFVDHRVNRHEKSLFVEQWYEKADFVDFQDLRDEVSLDSLQQGLHFEKQFCPAPHRSITIRADGTMLPCCTPHGAWYPLGIFPTMSILQAWEGSLIKTLRQDLLDDRYPLFCQNCLAAK